MEWESLNATLLVERKREVVMTIWARYQGCPVLFDPHPNLGIGGSSSKCDCPSRAFEQDKSAGSRLQLDWLVDGYRRLLPCFFAFVQVRVRRS